MESLTSQIKRHEGFRSKPYRDSVGKWTVGFGRNLDDNGISEEEAAYLLHNDIITVLNTLQSLVWCAGLNPARRNVIANMIFNMGLSRVLGFKKMIVAIKRRDFDEAAIEMLDSKWALQVHGRATELADQMRSGCCL